MDRLWIRARAPFAAYRWMQAGVFRATTPTMPPSAAYGLVLNLAGIETRDDAASVTTLVKAGLPRVRLAIGALREPEVASLYQQLHGYPVGTSSKELKPGTRGAKYHIAPVRREVLVGLDVMIGVESQEQELADRVRRGLQGTLGEARYGLPFAGENNLMFDAIDILDNPLQARWYCPVTTGQPARKGSARLTVGIDREDSSRTTSTLVAPELESRAQPPEAAWVWTPSAPS